MSRASQMIVLVEDDRQQRFVRRYLYRLGYSTHDVRFLSLPSGKGSGAHWVLERYADAVRVYRVQSVRATTALVVMIDADDGTVARRQRQFHDLAARAASERIVHLVPKW